MTNGTTSTRSVFTIVAWPRKGSTPWMSTATMTKMTFAGSPGREPGLDREDERGADDEDQALDLEADLGEPVEEGDQPRAVRAVAGPVDGEHRGAGLRALQAAQPEQEVGEVADDDDAQGLGEGEPEGHEDGAVDEVLDLDARAGPHAADVPRGRPSARDAGCSRCRASRPGRPGPPSAHADGLVGAVHGDGHVRQTMRARPRDVKPNSRTAGVRLGTGSSRWVATR